MYLTVKPWALRMLMLEAGILLKPVNRSRSARGRKKALSWRAKET